MPNRIQGAFSEEPRPQHIRHEDSPIFLESDKIDEASTVQESSPKRASAESHSHDIGEYSEPAELEFAHASEEEESVMPNRIQGAFSEEPRPQHIRHEDSPIFLESDQIDEASPVQESSPKRARVESHSHDIGECSEPAELEFAHLRDDRAHQHSSYNTPVACESLDQEQVSQLVLRLLRQKGEPIARLIEKRVANGAGAFLFKSDQFIETSVLDKALKTWRSELSTASAKPCSGEKPKTYASSCGGDIDPNVAATVRTVEDSHNEFHPPTQHPQGSSEASAPSVIKLKPEGWKQCAKMVECGVARDITSAAQAFLDAGGNPDLAAAMLLSNAAG
jgi:hypothetical protein